MDVIVCYTYLRSIFKNGIGSFFTVRCPSWHQPCTCVSGGLNRWYLLTYARLLAGSMGHRWELSTGSCAAPWLQYPARCTPSSSLPTPRLAARCLLAVLFSSFLGDPYQGLSCDARYRYSQRVINQTSLSSFSLYFNWPLICLSPQSVVVDFVWPFHIHDSPEASGYELMYLIHCMFSNYPCFGAI